MLSPGLVSKLSEGGWFEQNLSGESTLQKTTREKFVDLQFGEDPFISCIIIVKLSSYIISKSEFYFLRLFVSLYYLKN